MIRIAIADDHTVFREGLVSLLSEDNNVSIVAQAKNGKEVLEILENESIDVLILDIEMPEMDGFDTIREIRQLDIEVRVLVLTMHSSLQFIKNILKAGAHGYLPKDVGKTTLLNALDTIHRTGQFHSPETAKMIMDDLREDTHTTAISPREKEVIQLIADGYTTQEIAEKLYLSRHTIESHRKNILLKLGLKNSAGLVKYAIRKGIVYC
ncbi:response regulator transcription factor [Poritiphilus flavus]|uniref:Response regulator n=1 Tax=Poritiphilus flavus TaxID=2697053 RepID=A0A6L9EC33_9FLAO|nr:response regulator transcription factor [Poritiphilus flavus]NAS12290.1 response regulator [Poritiphilus flavus]